MNNNTLIEKLGYDASEKVVILHIDDIGFSHASNEASFEALDFGVASCGSMITPAPWFLEAASIYKNNPKYDLGVHLTLTCEYELYRWRALSSVDPNSGLLDSEKCLWRTSEEAVANISAKAAELEMRAQIQMALENQIDITHIDTHMGTVMNPKFLPSYLKMSREFNIPAFLPKVNKQMLIDEGLGDSADAIIKMFSQLEAKGIPMVDYMFKDTGGEYPNKMDYYCNLFSEIKPGLTHLLFHTAKLSPELTAITPDSATWRNQDYEVFSNTEIKKCVAKYDLKVIGYKEIRDYIRHM